MEIDFTPFGEAVARRFDWLSRHELYVVDLNGVDLFEIYLQAFPAGTNPTFRQRTEHDCNTCKNFVRRLGHVVAIVNGQIETVWGGAVSEAAYPYGQVAQTLNAMVRAKKIKSVFRTREHQYGAASSWDSTSNVRWSHFVGKIAGRHRSTTPEADVGSASSVAHVMRRGLDEIKPSAVGTILELIEAGQLYRGAEHKVLCQAFQRHLAAYREAEDRDVYVWQHCATAGAHFRNTVIGTLAVDLSEGADTERAVSSYEAKVAPQNYKRPTAVITKTMVDRAVKTISELGLDTALSRRYARLDDLSVNNVLWVCGEARGKMKDGSR